MKLIKSSLMIQYFTVLLYSYVILTVNNLFLCRAMADWNGCISDHSPLHWCLSQAALCQGWTTVSVENKDIYTHTYMCTHTHAQTHTQTLTHTYVSLKHTYMCTHTHTHTDTYTHICLPQTYIYVYTHTHTQTLTHTHVSLKHTYMCTHTHTHLSLIHIWRCRRVLRCRSRWSPYH